jgi:uncharacterized protein YndB with AHSA1/START domain
MTTKVEKTITVDLPVSRVYNQWTQFEEFPQFMGGISSVTQLSDTRMHWVAEIAGVKREWDAEILEQVPDQKIAWAATEGATNAGAVFFQDLGGEQTSVRLELEYAPEGLVEKAGDALGIVEKRAQADLEKFKQFIEERGTATGGWRGGVNEDGVPGAPGVEAAAGTVGDDGKAGLSGKVIAGAAAAVGVAVAAAVTRGEDEGSQDATSTTTVTPAQPVAVSTPTPVESDAVIPLSASGGEAAEVASATSVEELPDAGTGAGGLTAPR